MNNFFANIKDFVHSITTNDHYASYDASRPSGASRDQEQPLNTEYPSYPRAAGQRGAGYQQGSRSEQLNSGTTPGDIPMADYDMSAVPSPTVAWERIDKWIEQHYAELFDQLQEPATANDLDELEHDLDCRLPPDLRESYMVHDGQERGGRPSGLFFGITLLDIESLSEEWSVWRNTAVRINDLKSRAAANEPRTARSEWAERQLSVPADAIQTVYAHPGWIPLAKDFGGNNIAVDLAPGPKGRVGQVILFGRDFDTKFVVAESWGHFLDQFATDLESGNSFIDEDIEEAVFAYRLPTGRLTSYFTVLRSRIERQYRRSKPSAPSPHERSTASTPALISPAGSQINLTESNEETVMKLTPMPEVADLSLEEVNPEPETKAKPEPETKAKPEPLAETKPVSETEEEDEAEEEEAAEEEAAEEEAAEEQAAEEQAEEETEETVEVSLDDVEKDTKPKKGKKKRGKKTA